MEFSDALDKAERNESVQKLKGFFLGSGFASLSDAEKAAFDIAVEAGDELRLRAEGIPPSLPQ